jgi:putative transposase
MRMAYKCRAYPDPGQAAVLARTFGCVRVVWNRTLATRHARYHAEGKSTSYRESDAALTAMKHQPDLIWLNEVSSVPLQQALRHQHAAFQAFFQKLARYPRFKSRYGKQSATYTRAAFRWRDGQLTLAKTSAPLRFVWSWPDIDVATLDPSTVTVSRDPCGRWYVSLAVEVAEPEQLPATGAVVGVDLGIKDFAVTSDGEKIPNPGKLARRACALARYQRRLARCQKGSANRRKAKAKVARAHRMVRASRADFLHRASAALVRDHDVIVVEDLAVQNMVRKPKPKPDPARPGKYLPNGAAAKAGLNKSILDVGWGEFRRQLDYKASKYGRRIIVIDRWYPSSKTCSACGYLLGELSLKTRHWTCPSCRTRHDRDLNAAKNIRAAGLAVGTRNGADACGADVRPQGTPLRQPAVKQELSGVSPGIPRL